MPAPLAKGLLISLSVIFAAGLAVYENPQVRQWVDSSRRKIAIALHSLGDEITPPSNSRDSSPDASTREDESLEAVERRRKARQDILERGRAMEEKRRSKKEDNQKSRSFDSLVDKDGSLLVQKAAASTAAASTTAAELETPEPSLRKRNLDNNAADLGAVTANPFADEMHTELHASRPSTSIIPTSPTPSHLTPNKEPTPLIDTETASNHPSEALLDLTPTTSASSGFHADLSTLSANAPQSFPNHWSVHEWAENNTSPGNITPPRTEHAVLEAGDVSATDAPVTGGRLSRTASETGLDVWSEIGERVSTPGSWTEVGSVVSEDY
ncbi:hypothetical protein MMC07_006003 [Pseudocyphellaria aurata]|nr:hypothetical protein [Pseudocyphellaria aurata]